MRRFALTCLLALCPLVATSPALAQQRVILSIASGNTGGVFYPLAGGMAGVLSRQLPGWQVTAEVTGGSIDNLRLVGAGRADLALVMGDAAFDAFKGQDKFKGKPQPVRALLVLYPNRMHVATLEATGIATMADLKGKRVSVGAPGSATELMGTRVLDALGLADTVKRERLSVNESVNAMKDRKIDAFLWSGGVPTAALMDLAATPGGKLRLLDHGEAVDGMNRKHGPLYFKGQIPARVYQGVDKPVSSAMVWNLLVANASMPDDVAYAVVKTLTERKAELTAVHKEAEQIAFDTQGAGASAIPFHPGALRYFKEKGVKVQ
jgi:TRAP transporter TAXI family solute receptor